MLPAENAAIWWRQLSHMQKVFIASLNVSKLLSMCATFEIKK